MGIKTLPDAIRIAREADLDLVEVAPQAAPPVCRIMDYGKFKFDEAQRAKESRRKTTNVTVKEMKYRPKIGVGDFDTKTRQVARFLSEGHKVKVTIMFRGREVFYPELGKRILDRIAEQVDASAKVEAVPRLDGRNMTMVLAPDKRAQQAAAAKAPANGKARPTDGPESMARPTDGPEIEARVVVPPAEASTDRDSTDRDSTDSAVITEEGPADAQDEDRQGSSQALQSHGDGTNPSP